MKTQNSKDSFRDAIISYIVNIYFSLYVVVNVDANNLSLCRSSCITSNIFFNYSSIHAIVCFNVERVSIFIG